MVIYCECRAFAKIVITDDLQGRISQYKKSIIFLAGLQLRLLFLGSLILWFGSLDLGSALFFFPKILFKNSSASI